MRKAKEVFDKQERRVDSVVAPECIIVNKDSHRHYKWFLIIDNEDYNKYRTSELFIPKKLIYMWFSKRKKFKWVLVLLQ